jgi:hypothetical protein
MPHLMPRQSLILAIMMAAAGLAACNSFTHAPRYQGEVVATDAGNVTACRYLSELRGNSGLTGLFAPKGVDNVKQGLLQQAEALGATHVVWDQSSALRDNTSLSAKAYRCPPAGK